MTENGESTESNGDHEIIGVWMLHPDIHNAPVYPLPDGYRMRFFETGDIPIWVRIQQQSDELFTSTEATFVKYMPDSGKWPDRVMFLVSPSGEEIGTITAWNDSKLTGRDMGLVHWVAIVPEAQGRGLAKPMLSAALGVMRELGYTEASLDTQSARIPAINLYLHFGFKAFPREQADTDAWRAIAPQLKYSIQDL